MSQPSMGWIDTHLHLPVDHIYARSLVSKCTVPNPAYSEAERLGFSTRGIEPFLKLYVESKKSDTYIFPRQLFNSIRDWENTIEDRTSRGLHTHLGRAIKLRATQVEPVEQAVQFLKRDYGMTLIAPPGSGKTVASLEIARRMGVKVGVLVHQSFLLNQWVDRVKEFLGIDAGVVHQNRCEFDAPIVIMMAQSINARWDKYPKELFENIGLLIVDECHRFSAETFSESVQYFRSKYRLGLTATPDRADGMGWLFQAHIGEIKVRMSVDRDDPIVYVLNTPIKLASEKPLLSRGRPDLVKAVSYVVQSEARNRLIVKYMVEAVKNNRRPICFSDRRQHLIELADMFKETCAELGIRATFGFYVGGMTEQERTIASNRQAIFATYQFAKEGLDIPELDTIVFGTPKGDIIQAVGRIQRIMAGKPKPIVFDLVDNAITMSRGLFKKRMKQYEAQKWEIKTIRNP